MVRRWIQTVKSFPVPSAKAYQSAKKLAELYGQLHYDSRRDDTAVPLLAPNQDIYLREIFALACWSQHKLYRVTRKRLSPGAGERLHLGTCLLRY